MNNSTKKGLLIAFIIVTIIVLAFMVSEDPLHLFECTFQGVR